MSKQAIIAVIEDVIGEYVLNMTKKDLKVAMVRGKITLENVQLDGDLIGSHVLGAVGLSGFGILSCSARKLHITIPWGSLEKTPTKCEISGVHLVCVPLLPSNATRMCGAGTAADPRCTLRTRAKRAALARYERNFFAGRILGEGPMKNRNRKVELKRRTRAIRMSMESRKPSMVSADGGSGNDCAEDDNESDVGAMPYSDPNRSAGTTGEIRNALKMKLKAKAFRNIEASIRQIHIRCEVAKGALREESAYVSRSSDQTNEWKENPSGRAFAFGCIVDSFVVKTATSDWETGDCIFAGDRGRSSDTRSVVAASLGLLSSGPSYKVVEFSNVSLYWDDQPPFLVSEAELLRTVHNVVPQKIQKRVADAMEAMVDQQDPGECVRISLAASKSIGAGRKVDESSGASINGDSTTDGLDHDYCCSPFNLTFHSSFSDPALEGPSQWEAVLLPLDLHMRFKPHQYQQYQQLRKVMFEQRRVDTMLHQRPEKTALADPRAWWKFVISAVVARPNSRPWRDVKRIASSRPRYVELVRKKILNARNGSGFHGGLDDEESFELLALEDTLPIEALLAFHLLALRDVYHEQTTAGEDKRSEEALNSSLSKSNSSNPTKARAFKRITRKLLVGSGGSAVAKGTEVELEKRSDHDTTLDLPRVSPSVKSSALCSPDDSLIQMLFIVRDLFISVSLLDSNTGMPFVRSEFHAEARIFSSGLGINVKEVTLDLKRVDVDSIDRSSSRKILTIGSQPNTPSQQAGASNRNVPCSAAACRLMASRELNSVALGISARPATLIWNSDCFEKFASFLASPEEIIQDMLRSKLRKAATPLAYKAQVAILSPQALSVELNIDAPKVWFPITSSGTLTSDGAMYFDAGLLKVALSKGEGIANTSVLASISEINVKYCDNVSDFVLDSDGSVVPYVSMVKDGNSKEDVSVLRPFTVHIDATVAGDQARWGGTISSLLDQIDRGEGRHTASSIFVSVGDIYLDFVDADVLAKVIGRMYAAEIIRARQRREDGSTLDNGEQSSHRFGTSQSTGPAEQLAKDKSLRNMNPSCESVALTVTLERIELVLEGQAKASSSPRDSGDAVSVSRRNYIVQLLGMKVHHAKLSHEKLSRFSISDSSVTESSGLRHQIFGRSALMKGNYKNEKDRNDSFIRASSLRNGKEHTNELDVFVESFVFVVTPNITLDVLSVIAQIVELTKLCTQEMERKIHEIGRSARDRRNKGNRPLLHSPTSKASDSIVVNGNTGVLPSEDPEAPFPAKGTQSIDSSLSFRLSTNSGTLLIWGSKEAAVVPPLSTELPPTRSGTAALQIVSDALIMFQSVENDDASGTRTLHVSFRDLSAAIKGTSSVAGSDAPPVLEPAAADFRVTYSTQNLGSVVSQDFSLHCDSIISSLSLADAAVLKSMSELLSKTVAFSNVGRGNVPPDRIQFISRDRSKRKKTFGLGSLIQYKKSGSGIATSVRLEVDMMKCVLRRPQSSPVGTSPLFACNVEELKGNLGGCASALFGDIQATLALHYFRGDIQEWEYLIEPFRSDMMIEQMPNEIVVSATTLDSIRANFTSVLLGDIAELKFNFSGHTSAEPKISAVEKRETTPPLLDQRRSLHQAGSIYAVNECGCDIVICPVSSMSPKDIKMREIADDTPGCVLVRDGCEHELCSDPSNASASFAVGVSKTMNSMIGRREALLSLRVENSLVGSRSLHPLRPPSVVNQSDYCGDTSIRALYDIEPVVEWCLENQRLRPSVNDVYSLSKGRDLLCSHTWSPGDECYAGRLPEHTLQRRTTTPSSLPGNWTRPYLKDDCPDWTDVSGTLKLARERVVLPDDSWVWANSWEVHVCREYDETTDADGWEYERDFESFRRSRRSYKRGDTCRRRRWSRTRMIKPPRLDDPFRPLSLIWESRRQTDGSLAARLSSPVSVLNNTSETITIFLNNVSWEKEVVIGEACSKEALKVPIFLASASFMRLAISRTGACTENKGMRERGKALEKYFYSQMVMIIPVSFQSSTLRNASIIVDGDQRRKLHFHVNIQSMGDETQIIIDPVIQVINVLPCHLTYRVGEKGRDSSSVVERIQTDLGVGADSDCVAVDPRFKPHMSIRVPGYDWSSWKMVVNRKLSSMTWLPSRDDEEQLFLTQREDVDHSDDYKTIIELHRTGGGDGLTIIMSIEPGQIPVVRFYAQYWILDKTGFSLQFAEGSDVLGSMPSSGYPLRRSHHNRNPSEDTCRAYPGHQWSLGMDGTTMYFSCKERLAVAIESLSERRSGVFSLISKWSDPVDVANVMPRIALSLDEYHGDGRYELSLSVETCPSIFSSTKLITIVPRYQIKNLLGYDIFLAQDSRLDKRECIPSQKSAAFHWTMASLPPRVRVSPALYASTDKNKYRMGCQWTNGSIELDKVGITNMRMSTPESDGIKPKVIQVEVRLANKAQNSAVLVVISDAGEKGNSLYLLRNMSSRTVLVTQPLYINEAIDSDGLGFIDTSLLDKERTVLRRLLRKESARRFSVHSRSNKGFLAPFSGFDCGVLGSCAGGSVDDDDSNDEVYVWNLSRGDEFCFGFDDPEKPHLIEWTCTNGNNLSSETPQWDVGVISVDAIGSSSTLRFPDGGEVRCIVMAKHGSKVLEFADVRGSDEEKPSSSSLFCALEHRVLCQENTLSQGDDGTSNTISSSEVEDYVTLTLRTDVPVICISVVDNGSLCSAPGREVLLLHMDSVYVEFGQSRRGYHEVEMRISSIQIDNHVHKSTHSVALSCPRTDQNEPFLHFSAVRHLQTDAKTFIFPYVALRVLPVDLSLDRRTTEAFARFFEPMRKIQEKQVDPEEFLADITSSSVLGKSALRDASLNSGDEESLKATSDRIYIEKMILHPIRVSLTFNQLGLDDSTSTDGLFFIEFFRSLASITAAPLTFTSFVVGHAFESPHALARILTAHYTSQLFQQVFAVLGSLEILTVPADLLGNVGTGVVSFFYEPLQGLVQGPSQFIEGLETGTQSLVRGVFVGVVKSAASVTGIVNTNLAGLTADESFIGERNAHQKSLSEARRRGQAPKSISDSFVLAGASITRSVKSGAAGIVEQPSTYASKHGPIGFVKGMAKACVGAVVKPVVGFGDAAVLVLTHMSEATSDRTPSVKVPKRMRRALPRKRAMREVNLVPYDVQAADAQRTVTGNDSSDDVYVGHVCTPTHLLIASENCLTSIERNKSEPHTDVWPWADISHFSTLDGQNVRVSYFSSTGIQSSVFSAGSAATLLKLQELFSLQSKEMSSNALHSVTPFMDEEHVFGRCNIMRTFIDYTAKDEVDVIEQGCSRVRNLSSSSRSFFRRLDEEAWTLVDSWCHLVSGLRSRRCLVVGIINGTDANLQIKSTKLLEGGSPCYSLPTSEFYDDQGLLGPGGAIIYFVWGNPPNLNNHGDIFLNVETNAFTADFGGNKSTNSNYFPRCGHQLQFLEKSFDPSGWWAKFWVMSTKV